MSGTRQVDTLFPIKEKNVEAIGKKINITGLDKSLMAEIRVWYFN